MENTAAARWKERSIKRVSPSRKANTAHVLVLYVGGTIGMMPATADGSLGPVSGYLTSELRQMHELNETEDVVDEPSHPLGVERAKLEGNQQQVAASPSIRRQNPINVVPTFDIVEYTKLLDSSDMQPSDWIMIARDIERYYYLYDGFLIAHGTDTMHYTASALSFLLHNLGKPVILTGAMVPLVEPYNDARRNLVMGMMFAASPDICEVCLYSNDVLLRGNRSVKLRHTLSAFASPNYPPLAIMQAQSFRARRHLVLPAPTGPLGIHSDMSGRVMTILCHPDFDAQSVTKLLQNARGGKGTRHGLLDCLVLELMGIGDTASEASMRLKELIATAVNAGCVVVATLHDLYGGFSVSMLDRGRDFLGRDAVFVGDMTTEAAATKAMYLFGKGLPASRVRELMPQNLRGEVSTVTTSSRL